MCCAPTARPAAAAGPTTYRRRSTTASVASATVLRAPGVERFYDQDVAWAECDDGECAEVWVPVDYAAP